MIYDLWDMTIVRGTMKSVLLGQGVMSTVTKRITLSVPTTLQWKNENFIKGWKASPKCANQLNLQLATNANKDKNQFLDL